MAFKIHRFILSKENPRMDDVRARCIDLIKSIPGDEKIEITLKKHDPPRSLAQNAYYWAAYVAPLCEHFGYEKMEMHELLLAEHFGHKQVGMLVVPNKRTSDLKVKEMIEYLDWVPRFAAEHGVILSVPQS